MSDLNRVITIGRLVRDPDIKYTPNGTAVCNFDIANNESFKDSSGGKKEYVNYFPCTAWAGLGEVIQKHFTKGQQIIIEGKLRQRRWDDQDGKKRSQIEIVVENFNFCGGKKDE